MKRIVMICEGETEQTFAKTNLLNHFVSKNIHLQTPRIKASNGGIVKWDKLKDQIERHLKAEPEAYITTFIDYYGLYEKYQFPKWNEAHNFSDKNQCMDFLENAMLQSINPAFQNRFIPYLQLHEFEGLLFSDIEVIKNQIPAEDLVGLKELEETFANYPNPEMINNNRNTSPSRRLERIIKGYNKVVYGDILSAAIGLARIRTKSPRFNNWLCLLESI